MRVMLALLALLLVLLVLLVVMMHLIMTLQLAVMDLMICMLARALYLQHSGCHRMHTSMHDYRGRTGECRACLQWQEQAEQQR